MKPDCNSFPDHAARAVGDPVLQTSLARLQREFRVDRDAMLARLPEFDALCDTARDIKDHALEHLDFYLETFEKRVIAAGGHVHWCRSAAEARDAVLGICRAAGARTVAKGKSMISEEIALNAHLTDAGITPVETDLGEYILQLRHETPSHIVMPAIHLNAHQVGEAFRAGHPDLDPDRPLDRPALLLEEARTKLRDTFLTADVGITGANFLVAETGAAVVVTNEGNGDLTMTLPPVHIVLASIEKMVPSVADAMTLLRVLARSATTQEITSYTTFATGPRRAGDADGPGEFHVVLVDNGRSDILGGEFRDILRCIRCGACQSLCPVYGTIGGHAYGWVYAGPVGAVLSPALIGIDEARHLPEASTFCGKCEEVCPVRIPLLDLMRRWRQAAFQRGVTPTMQRRGVRLWAWFALRPALYRPLLRIVVAVLAAAGRKTGRFRRLPMLGGWTAGRDMPAPEGGTFMARWAASRRKAAS